MNIGVIGLPGSGKTIFMAWAASQYKNNDFTVYSNFKIVDEERKPITDRITSRQDLDRARSGYIFLDELAAWLDSRFSISEENSFVNAVLQKNRKREISLFWSAQSYGMVDKRLRLNTEYVILPEIYYTYDGEIGLSWDGKKWIKGSEEFTIKQDFFNPVDMSQYLPFARVRAFMFSSSLYENAEYILNSDIIRSFDFRMERIVNIYDTTEEITYLATSEEKKGELVEGRHKKALEEFYGVPVIQNPHSGIGMNSYDLELKVNGDLMIIDSTSVKITRKPNGKEYNYLCFSEKLPLTQYEEVEKSRDCKTYFMYEEPKYSGNMFLYPTQPLWNREKGTISTKLLEKDRIKIA